MVQIGRGGELSLAALMQLPSTHMVTTCHYPRPDALGDPGFHDEVARLGLDPYEVARRDPDLFGMIGVQPERVGMGDLVQPLRR